MWFDARAALESIGGGAHPAPDAPEKRNSLNSQDSQGWAAQGKVQRAQRDRTQFAGFAEFAAPQPKDAFSPHHAREAQSESDAFPYGTACDLGDTPRTWEGRVVSLAAWKRLTEWEKHGPNGRLWCGLCRCWHMPGDCTGGEPRTVPSAAAPASYV